MRHFPDRDLRGIRRRLRSGCHLPFRFRGILLGTGTDKTLADFRRLKFGDHDVLNMRLLILEKLQNT